MDRSPPCRLAQIDLYKHRKQAKEAGNKPKKRKENYLLKFLQLEWQLRLQSSSTPSPATSNHSLRKRAESTKSTRIMKKRGGGQPPEGIAYLRVTVTASKMRIDYGVSQQWRFTAGPLLMLFPPDTHVGYAINARIGRPTIRIVQLGLKVLSHMGCQLTQPHTAQHLQNSSTH